MAYRAITQRSFDLVGVERRMLEFVAEFFAVAAPDVGLDFDALGPACFEVGCFLAGSGVSVRVRSGLCTGVGGHGGEDEGANSAEGD